MKKVSRLLGFTIVAMLGLPATVQAQTNDSSDWQFAATIYGWFPDIGGHTELPLGAGGDIDVDIGTILDHLEMTAQGSFEFRKGRWGAFTDIVYLDVGESKSNTRDLAINGVPIPATVTAAIDFDLKSTFWTLAASYRGRPHDAATFDMLFGARLAQMKQELELDLQRKLRLDHASAHDRHSRLHPSISGMLSSGARGESRWVPVRSGLCLTTSTSAPGIQNLPGRLSSA